MESSCYLLLQTAAKHPVVGVSPTHSPNELLVTIQGTGVQKYEVRRGPPFPSGTRLT